MSQKIPVVKDKLYMKYKCSAICLLANFNIFMGDTDSVMFKEIIDLILFDVFFILMVFLKSLF